MALCCSMVFHIDFVFSSKRRHTRGELVTGVQTCALPIFSRSSGIELALDGDLLRPGASLDDPGATERAVRALRLDMSDAAIRRALEKGDAAEFEIGRASCRERVCQYV